MPHKLAAKKALRQNIKNNLINRMTISRIKTERKKFISLISNNELESANKQFSLTQSLLAKAAKKNVIHWKKAARLTSRMFQHFKKTVN